MDSSVMKTLSLSQPAGRCGFVPPSMTMLLSVMLSSLLILPPYKSWGCGGSWDDVLECLTCLCSWFCLVHFFHLTFRTFVPFPSLQNHLYFYSKKLCQVFFSFQGIQPSIQFYSETEGWKGWLVVDRTHPWNCGRKSSHKHKQFDSFLSSKH